MDQNWIAGLLIAFGILVAVLGVVAYLRMIRAARRGEPAPYLTPPDTEMTPSSGEPPGGKGSTEINRE